MSTYRATAIVALLFASSAVAQPPSPWSWCGTVEMSVGTGGAERRAAATDGILAWVELDRELFLCGDESSEAEVRRLVPLLVVARQVDPERLAFRHGGAPRSASAPAVELARGGRWSVVLWTGDPPRTVDATTGVDEHASSILPFRSGAVLAHQLDLSEGPRRTVFPPLTAEVVASLDAVRWYQALARLAAWNRWTRGSEIALARDWLVDRFEELPGFSVTTESFSVGGTPAFNVVATRPGTVRPDDWVLVGGHYDSTSENPSIAAPGAEDNASGCAGVLELARIFADHRTEATLVFLCYSGEEQGLYGSTHHAAGLVAGGDADKVVGAVIMDMIGYTSDADLDCLLETSSSQAGLLDVFADAAAAWAPELRIVTSFFPFGSDHIPYLNRGIPALLTIENDWDEYPGYHDSSDLPQFIDLDMGLGVLRMNAATVAALGGVREPPLFADGWESGDLTAWSFVAP